MLILARHGQTDANARGLILGRADPPLTELGRQQATALAASLPRPGRVISSSRVRAKDTAVTFGLPVEVDDRWVELDYGELDMRPASDPWFDLRARWEADPRWVPPGGESLATLSERVRSACEELAGEVSQTDVVVVSHVSPIKAAVAWALGVGDHIAFRTRLDVGAVCRVSVADEGPMLRSFNECSHLDGVGSLP